MRQVTAFVLVALVGIGLAIAAVGGGASSIPTPSTATPRTTASPGGSVQVPGPTCDSAGPHPWRAWQPIAESPLSPRHDQSAVWTGSELLIWGGETTANDAGGVFADDGARYSTASGTWEILPTSPLAGRTQHVAVWTGTEMIIWGGLLDGSKPGQIGAAGDGAAFNPADGSWTPLPEAPIAGRVGAAFTWTGRELVIWGGDTSPGVGGRDAQDGASYDPARRKWRLLPPVRVPSSMLDWMMWTGHDVLLLTYPEAESAPVLVSKFDSASWLWGPVVSGRTPALFTSAPIQVAGDVLVYGPEISSDETVHGYLFDEAIDRWVPYGAEVPRGNIEVTTWDGSEALAVGARAALDPRCQRWSPLPQEHRLPSEGYSAIWAGDRLIVWGGRSGEAASGSTSGFELRR